MGALYQIGTKELSKEELLEILDGTKEFSLKFVAPGSGLFLKELNFN
jgi:tRNA U38,U39,U40 pseudouridine synthase TruA